MLAPLRRTGFDSRPVHYREVGMSENTYEDGGYTECTHVSPYPEVDCHDEAKFVRYLSIMEQQNGEWATEECECVDCKKRWFV